MLVNVEIIKYLMLFQGEFSTSVYWCLLVFDKDVNQLKTSIYDVLRMCHILHVQYLTNNIKREGQKMV